MVSRKIGSSATAVLTPSGLDLGQDTLTQQLEACSSICCPLDHFQTIYVTLCNAI
jgi:hypothetical protein